ncbi:MAG: hypothetical protein CFE26_08135, partial [Verrucomicrobiales bacterium VVV1]
ALRLNGVWPAPGTYTSANSAGRISGSGSLIVTSPGPVGFTAWISNFPGLSNATASGDPDSDGVSNLLEYVLNGIPNSTNHSILPAASLTPTHFIFSFTQRTESTALTIQTFEYSTTLDDWTPIQITSPIAPEVTLGPITAGSRTVTISIPKSAAPTGRLFGRLVVLLP